MKIPVQPAVVKLPREADIIEQSPRPYLGMSQIGGSCQRQLWYYFRHVYTSKFSRRTMRIFERGNWEEERIVKELEELHGFTIEDTQMTYTDLEGHFNGHSDGGVRHPKLTNDERVVLEIKSMNQKAYTGLVKHGLKKSKPAYYAQIVLYMYYEGLERALYIVTNKDTEERKVFFVQANDEYAKEMIERAVGIIFSKTIPKKIGGPDWHECKWCDAYDICQFSEAPKDNCRLCAHALPERKGTWMCTKHTRLITEPCDGYSSLLSD